MKRATALLWKKHMRKIYLMNNELLLFYDANGCCIHRAGTINRNPAMLTIYIRYPASVAYIVRCRMRSRLTRIDRSIWR